MVTMDTEREPAVGRGREERLAPVLLSKPPPSLASSFPGPLGVGVLDLVPRDRTRERPECSSRRGLSPLGLACSK